MPVGEAKCPGVKCPGCNDIVKDKAKGVSCDMCESWYHLKCGDISSALYKALVEFDGNALGTGLHWYCPKCNGLAGKALIEIRGFKERQGIFEKEIEAMKKDIENLKGEIIKNCESIKNERIFAMTLARGEEQNVEMGKSSMVGKVMDAEDRKMQGQVLEMLEREKRKKNLIIMGVEEPADDKDATKDAKERDFIKGIINILGGEGLIRFDVIGRIGKKGERPRPMRIKIEDAGHRRKLLTKAKELKTTQGMSNIYIMPDLTRLQQADDKKLRDKLKEFRVANENNRGNIKIVKGEVVRENGGDREVLFSL